MKFCQTCGAQILLAAEICPRCGVRQPWVAGMPGGGGFSFGAGDGTTRTGKSKMAATLLAIFLGGLGVHKFYLGETGMGVVYLIFFWTFIPSIIGFVEGIIWLTQSNEQWLAKYGDR
jgi:TM2 domain-containing membrane protein YozV